MTAETRALLSGYTIGLAAALGSALSLLEIDARALGLVLAAVSVVAFAVAARSTALKWPDSRLWGVANAFGLWVITTLLTVVFGALVVWRFPTAPWFARMACAIVAAILASVVAAATPWLAAHVPHWTLRALAKAWAVIRGLLDAVGELAGGATAAGPLPEAMNGGPAEAETRWDRLLDLTAGWQFPPSRARVLRCVAMGSGGIVLSLAAQELSYLSGLADQKSDVYLPLLGWCVGSIAGWMVGARLFQPIEPPPAGQHVAHGTGLATGVILLMFLPFGYWATYEARADLFTRDASITYGSDEVDVGTLADQPLADTFLPVFQFATDENWHPTSVAWYRAKAIIQEPFEKGTEFRPIAGRHVQPKNVMCKNTCLRLKECDDVIGACAPDGEPGSSTVYALTKRLDAGEMPPRTPYAGVNRMVQYWAFYNYDAFNRFVLSQWHQSDWEQITVGLADGVPKFVGYSSHCFGTWLPWNQVRVRNRTHPLVWVAEGTHANYPRPLEAPLRGGRCPSFDPQKHLGVAGLAFGLVEAGGSVEVPADVAAGLTDDIGDDTETRPVRALFIPDPSGSAIDFVGAWGVDNNIAPFRFNPVKSGGPASPTAHAEWKRPGAAMLCNSKWFAPDDAKPNKQSCAAVQRR